MLNKESVIPRIMSKVEMVTESGCWIWTGETMRVGYGRLSVGDKYFRVHRLAYMVFKGDIPAEQCVCHSCDVPSCVNPAHLWVGTPKENAIDCAVKGRIKNQNTGKTHCHQGHEYVGYNLILRKDGYRGCRTCLRSLHRKYRALKGA